MDIYKGGIMPDTAQTTATYTQFRIKCMSCGLHFIICTDYPERHGMETVYCPECGQHGGGYLIYEAKVPGFIFEAVPGDITDPKMLDFKPAKVN